MPTTSTMAPPPPQRSLNIPRPHHWHRPLMWVSAGMALMTVGFTIMSLIDPRELMGQNLWFKPLKFSLSIGLYCVSLAWMLGQFQRWRTAAWYAGTVTAVGLAVEMAIIGFAAAMGQRSHFNLTEVPWDTLYSVMGASIAIVWVMALVVAVVLVVNPMRDPARNLALRAGTAIGIVGMAVAFFMVLPTGEQLSDFQGIVGAHAVGVPDGGPGLPFLGWSTVGGDLRVAHFIGLHALQLLPLFALGLEVLSRRTVALRDPRVRFRLVGAAALAFAAVVTVTTLQALAGEPVVAPSAPFFVAGVSIAVLVVAGSIVAIMSARPEVNEAAEAEPKPAGL